MALVPCGIFLDHRDAVEPAGHEVLHGLGRLVDEVLPRHQGVGDDVGGRGGRHQHVRLVAARAATAPERSGSQVTAASTLPALKAAAAWGASGEDQVLLDRVARSSGERPDCESR